MSLRLLYYPGMLRACRPEEALRSPDFLGSFYKTLDRLRALEGPSAKGLRRVLVQVQDQTKGLYSVIRR